MQRIKFVVPVITFLMVCSAPHNPEVNNAPGKYAANTIGASYEKSPYPMSRYITDVEFASMEKIIRKGCGSDNWPLTWADDGHMYTAYGDGWGFKPKTEDKLSLGLAKIVGGPDDFRGVNIRSESGEHYGGGENGKKASGILMVDGVLYMWLRNANEAGRHSQLAWSEDYGKNWKFSQWKFTESFGYPTFLNFGRNYRNTRDNFVYVYSHNENSAYEPTDHMVLARVPKDKIKQCKAYDFFVKLKADKPVWSDNIEDRGPVFTNPGECYRSGITYNDGLDKYLWCQTLPGSSDSKGLRFSGGFGIFEASEPWGPWKTVFYTREWDVGLGETSSLPTKWMSEDGTTCHLVFSGEDCFSVRKVKFKVKGLY